MRRNKIFHLARAPLFVTVAVLLLLAASTTSSPISATNGTLNIMNNTTLTEDHSGNIVIGASNVTLDCNGHSITGQASGIGISLTNRTDVTVKNCHVTNFLIGFVVFASNDNTLTDNLAEGNETGIALNQADGNTLVGNVASHNTGDGINLFDSSENNVLEGNTANSNTTNGFSLNLGAVGNILDGNVANNNLIGFFLVSSSYNTLKGNTANSNTHGFFLAEGAVGNILDGNVANDNLDNGINLNQADGNSIEGNEVNGNGLNGISLRVSNRNVIKGNTVTGTPVGDGIDFNTESVGNDVHHNIFDGNRRGIKVYRNSDNNLIHHNTVTASVREGIRIGRGADSNQVFNNSVHNSGRNGLSVIIPDPNNLDPNPLFNTEPENNFISDNTLQGNGSGDSAFFDIFDETTDGGTLGTRNVYQGNICDTSSPIGLCEDEDEDEDDDDDDDDDEDED